jgi:hypothetical protein
MTSGQALEILSEAKLFFMLLLGESDDILLNLKLDSLDSRSNLDLQVV